MTVMNMATVDFDIQDENDPWSYVPPLPGQEDLFPHLPASTHRPLALADTDSDMTIPSGPVRTPRRKPVRRSPATFRRADGGSRLSVTVKCDGQTHRLTIDADGNVNPLNHDAAGMEFLRAMGNHDIFQCEEIEQAAAAARIWLNRRLRYDAAPGHYDSNRDWKSNEHFGCCRNIGGGRAAYNRSHRETQRRSNLAWRTGYAANAALLHARTVKHLAQSVRVNEDYTRKIAEFLCQARGISADPRDLPASSRTELAQILPPATSDADIDKVWDMGMPLPWLRTMLSVQPAPDVVRSQWVSNDEMAAADYARRTFHLLQNWWLLGVRTDWIEQVAPVAETVLPATNEYNGWQSSVVRWHGQDAQEINAYLSLGVVNDIPGLISKKITPEQALAFQDLRDHDGGSNTHRAGLTTWLDNGATYETAMTLVALSPDARPVNTRSFRDVMWEVERSMRPERPTAEQTQRIFAIMSLVGTPGRTLRWHETGLPLDVIASNLARKVAPGAAVKAFEKAQRVSQAQQTR